MTAECLLRSGNRYYVSNLATFAYAPGSLGQNHLHDHRPDKRGEGDQPSSGRDVELITPVLPRDAKGRAAGELHLLAGSAVVALGYLHALEDALVLGAQLSKISESESSHPAVV